MSLQIFFSNISVFGESHLHLKWPDHLCTPNAVGLVIDVAAAPLKHPHSYSIRSVLNRRDI